MTVKKVFNKLISKFTGSSILNWTTSRSAPDKKGADFVQSYAGWMYTAADAIATDFSQIDLKLKHVDKKGAVIDDLTNNGRAEVEVLKNPNNAMTFTQLLSLTQVYMSIQGKAYWYVIRGDMGGDPIGVLPLMPYRVQPIVQDNPLNPIKGYVYTTDKGKQVPLDPNEVIHFREIDPRDPISGGYAAAFAVAKDIDSSEYSKEFNRDFFFNGATLSGVISTEKTLDDEQFDKLRNQWHKTYSGRENSHKTAILHKGLKYDTMGISHKEMSFGELSKDTRDSILAAFRVPKSVVGIVEDVNRANAEATDYIFAKRTINPKQKSFADTLNKFWLPLFKSGSINRRFEHVNQTPRDTVALVDKHTRLVGSGIETPNEAREDFGLSPLSNGDQTYMPMMLLPSDTVKAKGILTIKGAVDGEVIDESKKKTSVQKKQLKSNKDSAAISIVK